jgi:hypothetical protein
MARAGNGVGGGADMGRSVPLNVEAAEVKKSHRDPESSIDAVQNLHHVQLRMAKARIGHAVERAIGDQPLKAFGHEGLVSAICSGERVPDYLGRIAQDHDARRRFALALLEDDSGVIITTTITIQQKKSA